MEKKKIALILLSMVMALSLLFVVGCGNDENPPAEIVISLSQDEINMDLYDDAQLTATVTGGGAIKPTE